eukprot:UN02222
MKSIKFVSKQFKDLFVKRNVKPQRQSLKLYPIQNIHHPLAYNKNIHQSHEYGFHPSLRSHFIHQQTGLRSFATQTPQMSATAVKEMGFEQNDFYEFEQFNDYFQFGNTVTFDAVDLFIGSAAVLFGGGLFVYGFKDEIIKADDNLMDSALFG